MFDFSPKLLSCVWTLLQQKYAAVVHIALIHGTTNKRRGQVTPSKIEFCTCAFYQQKIRIQHKIFYTISPNTSTTWYRYKSTNARRVAVPMRMRIPIGIMNTLCSLEYNPSYRPKKIHESGCKGFLNALFPNDFFF